MPEMHTCPGLEDLRQSERNRNRDKLENDRTLVLKGL